MTVTTNVLSPAVPRDRWGRPMVVPPDGGKPVAYTRCTTFVGALEDTYNLEKWKMRMTALGLAERADLQLAVVAHRDDKDRLNEIVDKAVEYAKASAAATTGTALHALVDQHDRGMLDMARVPEAYRADIEAYAAATKSLRVEDIEGFGVLDSLRVAGTWDRRYRLPSGLRVIGDTKTGSIEYGIGKIAMQLAVYAHCTPYDVTNGRGEPNSMTVSQDVALVVHLPAGQGRCELVEVDIAAGWEAVQLAREVRKWRARKDLSWPYVPTALNIAPDPLSNLIATAPSVAVLTELWQANNPGRWSEAHTELARARRALIEGNVA